jgi:hypothetical protein
MSIISGSDDDIIQVWDAINHGREVKCSKLQNIDRLANSFYRNLTKAQPYSLIAQKWKMAGQWAQIMSVCSGFR